MSDLSNSARPPSTVSINLPIGVLVYAQGSANDKKFASLAFVALRMLRRSNVDRASLSNRVTTNVSFD